MKNKPTGGRLFSSGEVIPHRIKAPSSGKCAKPDVLYILWSVVYRFKYYHCKVFDKKRHGHRDVRYTLNAPRAPFLPCGDTESSVDEGASHAHLHQPGPPSLGHHWDAHTQGEGCSVDYLKLEVLWSLCLGHACMGGWKWISVVMKETWVDWILLETALGVI